MMSQAFHLTAWGYGRDLVRDWSIKGLDSWNIRPWVLRDITIKGVELLVWHSPCWYEWFMVGNSYTSDIMLMGHGSQRRIANFGLDFKLGHRDGSYVDLHCRAIGFASVFLNFYYEPAK